MILSPMTMEHADKMLTWKNYPETRQFAIASQLAIKKEDHLNWLEEHIPEFRVIVKHGGEVVGAIRVKDNEVSIWVDRAWWKHGIATFILQHHAQDRGMTAKIVDGNIASMRAFIRAGFLPISRKEPETIVEQIPDWETAFNTYEKMAIRERLIPSYYIFKKV